MNTPLLLIIMTLPRLPKKTPKTVSVTIRLSPDVANYLKVLSKEHGLSQADVVEYLISAEYKLYIERKKAKNEKES